MRAETTERSLRFGKGAVKFANLLLQMGRRTDIKPREPAMQAIVVFHDRGAGFWPWLFGRPGFRHCFVALNDGRAWIVLDPCSHGTKVDAEIAADCDLAGFYRDCGFTVLEGRVTRQPTPYPVWFFTCVEAVKRVLGVRGWWIWTPYHLYRHLETIHGFDLQPAEAEGATAAPATADTGRPFH